jgi:histone H2A
MATPSRKSATKKASKKSGSKTAKAGLIFPVARMGAMLRKGRYAKRVSASAGVYAAAVLEYLVSEVLELASKAVLASKKKSTRITPRALTLAVRHDTDLGELLKNVTLSNGGVVPGVSKALDSKKSKKSKKSSATPKV